MAGLGFLQPLQNPVVVPQVLQPADYVLAGQQVPEVIQDHLIPTERTMRRRNRQLIENMDWDEFADFQVFYARKIQEIMRTIYPEANVVADSGNDGFYFQLSMFGQSIGHATFHTTPLRELPPGHNPDPGIGAFHIKSDRRADFYYLRYTPLANGQGQVKWRRANVLMPAPAVALNNPRLEEDFGIAVFTAINYRITLPGNILHGGGNNKDCIEMNDKISIFMKDIDEKYKTVEIIYSDEYPDLPIILTDGSINEDITLDKLSENAQKCFKTTFEMARLLIHPEEVPLGTKEDIDKLMETEWGKKHIIIDETNNTTNKNKPANSLAPTVSNATKNKNKLAATTTADPPAAAAQGGKRKTRKHKQKQRKQRKTRSRR